MVKRSRYKKYKNKSKKIYKGGAVPDAASAASASAASALPGGPGVVMPDFNEMLNKIMVFMDPLTPLKVIGNEFIFSVGMLNDILLLTGLYIKNLFYLGNDSNLNNILPPGVCYDLFAETTCNSKIRKLLNIKSLKDELPFLPKELIWDIGLPQRGGTKRSNSHVRRRRTQRGGGINQQCQDNDNPDLICTDARPIENLHKPVVPPYIHPFISLIKDAHPTLRRGELGVFPDKESENVYLMKEFNQYNLDSLYKILILFKILFSTITMDNNSIIDETPEPVSKKYKLKKNDIIRIVHNFKLLLSVKEWKQCNDYHLGRTIPDGDVAKKCDIKCPECTMKRQTDLYTPDTTNYSPEFNNSFNILNDILNMYYTTTKSNTYNHSDIYEILSNPDKRIQLIKKIDDDELFDFLNIGEPKMKDDLTIDAGLLEQLRKTALKYKADQIHRYASKVLLYKLFVKADKTQQTDFQSSNLNTNGESLSTLIG